ncbi:MAG: hypothetical protein K2G63_03200 [Oscillospiraceae bacterium]|nr:hypothetical protein [Oscillospiraceae bacterium]
MKGINKATIIIAKILEVGYWIATVCMIILLVYSTAFKSQLSNVVSDMKDSGLEISASGFEIMIADEDGNINAKAITVFAIDGIMASALMAMIFRNVYLIVKTANGKTNFSKGNSPFQKDIIRMIREIGIFCIAISVIGIIVQTVAGVVLGSDIEVSVRLDRIVIGLMMICLSNYFAYGSELQKDVDGLL